VVEAPQDLEFAREALLGDPAEELGAQDLDRDLSAIPVVASGEDEPHRALADDLDRPEVAEPMGKVAGERRRVLGGAPRRSATTGIARLAPGRQ
jgi:hypothetical protein